MTEHTPHAPQLPADPAAVIAWFEAHGDISAERCSDCHCPLAQYLSAHGSQYVRIGCGLYLTGHDRPWRGMPNWAEIFVAEVDRDANEGDKVSLAEAAATLRTIAQQRDSAEVGG